MNLENEERTGSSKYGIIPQMLEKVHDVVLHCRRVKEKEIDTIVSMPTERFPCHIKHDLSKLSLRWGGFY